MSIFDRYGGKYLPLKIPKKVGMVRTLIISSASHPRQGWEAKFQSMAAAGDDHLLDGELAVNHNGDQDEWQW